jgi:hypothetical protein
MGGKSTTVVTFPMPPAAMPGGGKRFLSAGSKPSLNQSLGHSKPPGKSGLLRADFVSYPTASAKSAAFLQHLGRT